MPEIVRNKPRMESDSNLILISVNRAAALFKGMLLNMVDYVKQFGYYNL